MTMNWPGCSCGPRGHHVATVKWPLGAGGGIRTHTGGLLRPVPLPLGYAGLRLRAHQVSVSAVLLGERIRRFASRLAAWSPSDVPAQDMGQTPRSLRSLATWPVARTW